MKYFARVGGQEFEFRFERRDGALWVHSADVCRRVESSLVSDGNGLSLLVDGRSQDVLFEREAGKLFVQWQGERVAVQVEDERERMAQRVAGGKSGGRRTFVAMMPGVVVSVGVAEGDVVDAGATLVVLEAMKMQNPLQADGPCRVTRVLCRAGEAVAGGAVLVEVDEVS
jgi:biotin carboxyl carrier protein